MVKLESRPPDAEGRGEVTVRELIVNAVRMRPDRIILGECHSSEVLDLLEAITTGHDGTMCSIHATSPRDALGRLEAMATMHPVSLPLLTIRQKMASGLDLITQQELMRDGKRKITRISEVAGMAGESVATQDIFEFVQTEFKDGRIIGHFAPTGYVPTFVQRLADEGITFPDGFFEPAE
jgi:pilus assembly protein CpaF